MTKINSIILFLLLTVSFELSSQDLKWGEYDIDTIVSVNMPGEEIYELDTIAQGLKLYQLYTSIDSVTFVAQKSPCDDKIKDKILSKLPYDKQSLLKYYDAFTKGMANSMNSAKVEKNEIINSGLLGRKVIFKDSLGYVFYECHMYVLEDNIYNFGVFTDGEYDQDLKNFYFSFIKIKNPQSINQFHGKSLGYKQGYLFGKILFGGLVLITIIYFIIRWARKM